MKFRLIFWSPEILKYGKICFGHGFECFVYVRYLNWCMNIEAIAMPYVMAVFVYSRLKTQQIDFSFDMPPPFF